MPESPTPVAKLTTALVDLGTTPDAVADTLLLHGVTGVRSNGGECPITRWVKRQVPEVAHLFTCVVPWGDDNLWIDDKFVIGQIGGAAVTIRLPVAVEDFIVDFDRGVYPWLVEAPAVAA